VINLLIAYFYLPYMTLMSFEGSKIVKRNFHNCVLWMRAQVSNSLCEICRSVRAVYYAQWWAALLCISDIYLL